MPLRFERMFRPDLTGFKVREFFIDLLGCLIPGFLFIFMSVVFLCMPLHELACNMMLCESKNNYWMSDFRFEVIFFGIAISYAVGHFFYRKSPKLPDLMSVWRTKHELIKDAPAVLLEIPPKLGWFERIKEDLQVFWGIVPSIVKDLENQKKVDVQYPYVRIKEYLKHRGLDHLANIIPWEGAQKETHRFRTKAFINLLKIRLEFDVPDKCGSIIRNEGHIRLMSSIWYMSCYLQRFALISFLIGLLSLLVLTHRFSWSLSSFIGFGPLTCIGLMTILMLVVRLIIEKFFHYQRVREIFYVLETAWYASNYGFLSPETDKKIPIPDILKDLGPER